MILFVWAKRNFIFVDQTGWTSNFVGVFSYASIKMLPKGISMKLSSSGVLYPTKLPNLVMAPDLTDLIKLDPKKLCASSYCRSFAKIPKTATSCNKERAALLHDVFGFSIDAYAKE